jgi:MauM/NapG family ferredoxin protein
MADDPLKPDLPRGRRDFFWRGLGKMLDPLAEYLEQRLPGIMPREHLRPPGAITEKQLRETCYRCGNCVEVCPANAIRRLASDKGDDNGTPYIDPDISACRICENLECMRVCPSGALRLVESKFDIRMGLAVARHDLCLRTRGDQCTLCIDQCPLGAHAIRLSADGRVEILDPGCVGCGVCQFVCPTTPKAIRIDPL